MRNKQETAFTLIELLVVIATIALLTSIVLVALKGGREKANIAKVLQWARSVEAQLGGDIVGSWNFNEGQGTTAYDATGYNNGTLMNGVSWTDGVQGLTGKALSFDGSDDYVVVNDSDSLDSVRTAITIMAWIYPKSISTTQRLADKFIMGSGFLFRIQSNNVLQLVITAPVVGFYGESNANTLTIDKWQQVAVSYNGNQASFYINGILWGSPSFTQTINANTRNLTIGGGSWG